MASHTTQSVRQALDVLRDSQVRQTPTAGTTARRDPWNATGADPALVNAWSHIIDYSAEPILRDLLDGSLDLGRELIATQALLDITDSQLDEEPGFFSFIGKFLGIVVFSVIVGCSISFALPIAVQEMRNVGLIGAPIVTPDAQQIQDLTERVRQLEENTRPSQTQPDSITK